MSCVLVSHACTHYGPILVMVMLETPHGYLKINVQLAYFIPLSKTNLFCVFPGVTKAK